MKKIIFCCLVLVSCNTKQDIDSVSDRIDENMKGQKEFDKILKEMDTNNSQSDSVSGEAIADSLGWFN